MVSESRRACCPVCTHTVRLRRDGTLYRHTFGGLRIQCAGTGRHPAPNSVVTPPGPTISVAADRLVGAPIPWLATGSKPSAHVSHHYDGACAICRSGDQPDALVAVLTAAAPYLHVNHHRDLHHEVAELRAEVVRLREAGEAMDAAWSAFMDETDSTRAEQAIAGLRDALAPSRSDAGQGLPTQRQVLDWVRRHYPSKADPEGRALKLGEEAGGVQGAVIKIAEGRKTIEDLRTELAQLALCTMGLAESVGVDLQAAVGSEWAGALRAEHPAGGSSCGGVADA